MYKKILVVLFAVVVVCGNGCGNSRVNEGKSTLSTSTDSWVAVATSTIDQKDPVATSSVSLIDKPVSQWPRYEFKELGFSMQLPFVYDSEQPHSYYECSGKDFINGCDPTASGKPFAWFSQSINEGALTAASANYSRDTEWSLMFVQDFSYKNGSYFIYDYKLNPLATLVVNKFNILVFNASKDIYAKFGDTSYSVPENDVTAIVRLPQHRFFKSAILTFPERTLTLAAMKKALATLRQMP